MATQARRDPNALRARTAARAYAIWESEGRPHGRDYEHWLRAEREIAAQADRPSQTPPPRPARKPEAKKPAAKPRKA
jgi:hypothetical protein